jgi:hypothetical protein
MDHAGSLRRLSTVAALFHENQKEFGAQNRASGWNFWLTFASSPAPPASASPLAQSMAYK